MIFIYVWMAVFAIPIFAIAENFPVSYTEPSGTGFAQTCVYSCVQYNTSVCQCVPTIVRVCTANQNGATAEVINVSWDVPIKDGQLPVCVNYAVTSRDSEGNESAQVAPAAGSHVFTAP